MLSKRISPTDSQNQVSFLAIEHVGSTSIGHLVAKPMIDILIVVADADFNDDQRERLKEVLCFGWDLHHGGYSYKSESSIRGRSKFTLQGVIPERKIAVVAEKSIYRRRSLASRGYVEDRLGAPGGVRSGEAAAHADTQSMNYGILNREERSHQRDLEKGRMDRRRRRLKGRDGDEVVP